MAPKHRWVNGTVAGLTNKQQAFINAYFECGFNATEAARRAGYSERTARSIGAENLTKPDIVAEVQRRMAEKAMPADEVLARLSDHARGSMADFISTDDTGKPTGFNLGKDAPQYLIKKVSITEKGITFELYDAQAALVNLGKIHGLFVERHELTWRDKLQQHGHNPDTIKQQLVATAVAALRGADRGDDPGSAGGSPAAD